MATVSPDLPWPPEAPDPPWLPECLAPPWVPERAPPWRPHVLFPCPLRPPDCPPPPPHWMLYGAGHAYWEGGGVVVRPVPPCLVFPSLLCPYMVLLVSCLLLVAVSPCHVSWLCSRCPLLVWSIIVCSAPCFLSAVKCPLRSKIKCCLEELPVSFAPSSQHTWQSASKYVEIVCLCSEQYWTHFRSGISTNQNRQFFTIYYSNYLVALHVLC